MYVEKITLLTTWESRSSSIERLSQPGTSSGTLQLRPDSYPTPLFSLTCTPQKPYRAPPAAGCTRSGSFGPLFCRLALTRVGEPGIRGLCHFFLCLQDIGSRLNQGERRCRRDTPIPIVHFSPNLFSIRFDKKKLVKGVHPLSPDLEVRGGTGSVAGGIQQGTTRVYLCFMSSLDRVLGACFVHCVSVHPLYIAQPRPPGVCDSRSRESLLRT